MSLREKLKIHRKDAGYTQESFATKLKTSVKTIRHIEQGRRFPREELLKKIMSALKITDISVFEDIKKSNRGDVSKSICQYMNDLTKNNKDYSVEIVKAIRASIFIELKDRKNNELDIKSHSQNGKWEIYKRVAFFATKKIENEITANDVCLFRRCTRLEFTDRTGKTTWSIPEERKRQGCSPKTGKITDI